MTNLEAVIFVAIMFIGLPLLAEFLFSLGTIFFFVFVASAAWLLVRVWKGVNNG
jgi:hypothetical protein